MWLGGEAGASLSLRWRQMSDEEKQPYVVLGEAAAEVARTGEKAWPRQRRQGQAAILDVANPEATPRDDDAPAILGAAGPEDEALALQGVPAYPRWQDSTIAKRARAESQLVKVDEDIFIGRVNSKRFVAHSLVEGFQLLVGPKDSPWLRQAMYYT